MNLIDSKYIEYIVYSLYKYSIFNMKSTKKTKSTRKTIRKTSSFEGDSIQCEDIEEYNETVNYFIKYWMQWKENEILLSRIKEKIFEIDIMNKSISQ